MNIINRRIKDLRAHEELTLRAFAARYASSEAAQCRYESGQRMPGADVIKAIAIAYAVSADWLLGITSKRVVDKGQAHDKYNPTTTEPTK